MYIVVTVSTVTTQQNSRKARIVLYELLALSHTAADTQVRNADLERAASLGAAVAALRSRSKRCAASPSTDMTPAMPTIPAVPAIVVTPTNAAVCLAAS